MEKQLLFLLDFENESAMIQGVYRESEGVIKYKNLECTKEFTNVEDFKLDNLASDTIPTLALIKSIQLDESLLKRVSEATGMKLKVVYNFDDLPPEALKKKA